MNKLRAIELGYYLSSFFFMKINTNEELDNIGKLSKESKATFIHEYIHFLQDISSTFGLLQIMHICDVLISMAEQLSRIDETEFKVPVVIDKAEKVIKAIDILSVFKGDDKFNFEYNEIINVTISPEDLIEDFEVFNVEVDCRNAKGETKSFLFGTTCIVESMAYHVENYLFEDVNPPQFPYKVCESIIGFIYPELLKDEMNIIVLCDISLNTNNPSKYFIDFLNQMKNDNFLPDSPIKLVKYLEKLNFPINDKDYNYFEFYEQVLSQTKEKLELLLYYENLKPLREWISNLLESVKVKRKENFNFLIEIIKTEDSPLDKLFEFIDSVGVPLMANVQDSYSFKAPSQEVFDQMPFFRGIFEIYCVLLGKQTNCNLVPLCQLTGIVNDDCHNSPWKWSEKAKKCTFGLMWHLYGLQGKYPEILK